MKAKSQVILSVCLSQSSTNLTLVRVLFTHELDSQNAFSAVDSGTFTDLPNGDGLETGQMPRHDLPGAPVSEYEEVWRELNPKEGPEGENRGVSWILESVGEDFGDQEGEIRVVKTFLGRVWGTYVALRQMQTHTRNRTPSGEWKVYKTGTDVSARREEWEPGFGWRAKYVIGKDTNTLPSLNNRFGNKGKVLRSPGEKIIIGKETYIVRALEEIAGGKVEIPKL